tara:strand:+ start:9343 stop:9786 length:444 start_codon:yes stop_codon:yes gene_type:complete
MKFNRLILHCSATDKSKDISTETIKRWHTSSPRNWSDIGYHFVILNDGCGTVERGRPIWKSGAHTRGHNQSIGVCYVGGMEDGQPKDTMTGIQECAFFELVDKLRDIFGEVSIYGHNEFSHKACPSFDVVEKWGQTFTQRFEERSEQ